MNDGPKFGYTFALLFFGAVFGAIGVLWQAARTVFFLGAVLCSVGLVVIWIDALVISRANYWQILGWAAKDISQLPDERFHVLGLMYPKIRVSVRDQRAVPFYDDTNATMEQFRIFINGSDAQQIYPERNCTAELPRSIWNEIRINLEDYGYILKESNAGSHSWLWTTPQTYNNIRSLYSKWIYRPIQKIE